MKGYKKLNRLTAKVKRQVGHEIDRDLSGEWSSYPNRAESHARDVAWDVVTDEYPNIPHDEAQTKVNRILHELGMSSGHIDPEFDFG